MADLQNLEAGTPLWYLYTQRGGYNLVTKVKARSCGYLDRRGRLAIEVERTDGAFVRRFVLLTSVQLRETADA